MDGGYFIGALQATAGVVGTAVNTPVSGVKTCTKRDFN
jgi:hypothetical protein